MAKFWDSEFPVGYYDSVFKEGLRKGRGIQANWHNLTFKKIKLYLKDNMDHLDYACGPGTFIGNFSNVNSIGVDIANNQIEYASNNYQNKFKFYNLEEFQIHHSKDKFDLITVLGLFEFINEDEMISVLDQLYEKLNPKGKLIFTTPNFNNFQFRLLLLLLNFFNDTNYKKQHINKLNLKKIKNVVQRSKFEKKFIMINKFLNLGISLSIFNLKLGEKANNIVENLFLNKYGYLICCTLEKKL
jgi:2-polyprenyl-3-methyl-5-hydroxy-6-metoxy-1,4-benzoquinol methylase